MCSSAARHQHCACEGMPVNAMARVQAQLKAARESITRPCSSRMCGRCRQCTAPTEKRAVPRSVRSLLVLPSMGVLVLGMFLLLLPSAMAAPMALTHGSALATRGDPALAMDGPLVPTDALPLPNPQTQALDCSHLTEQSSQAADAGADDASALAELAAPARRLRSHGSEASRNLKVGLAFAMLAEAVVGVCIPVFGTVFLGRRANRALTLLNIFSGGVFLAVGLTHVLMDAIDAQDSLTLKAQYPLAPVMATVGFLIVFFVDRIIFQHQDVNCNVTAIRATFPGPAASADVEAQKEHARMNDFMERAAMKTGSIAILCAILVHSLIGDGLAIGFANTTADALTTFVGVAGHKAFASISLASRFLMDGTSRFETAWWMLPFVLSSPVAIFIGMALTGKSAALTAVMQGLSCGTFIYVGAFEILAREFGSHHHGRPSPALEGEHCDHDGERCGEELHYGPPRTFRARAEMFFAYLIGILGIALLGFGPH